ncbi:hypothetical protein CW304_15855 [Bacillus sp. UFRGS-B20]|nr:hypothetical protein CW304_15855 [Bacillus sp. UFRGS-B20]
MGDTLTYTVLYGQGKQMATIVFTDVIPTGTTSF